MANVKRVLTRNPRHAAPPTSVSPLTILFELFIVAGILFLYARFPWSNAHHFSVAAGRGVTAAELSASARSPSWEAGTPLANGAADLERGSEGGADDGAGGRGSFETGRANDGGALEADASTRGKGREGGAAVVSAARTLTAPAVAAPAVVAPAVVAPAVVAPAVVAPAVAAAAATLARPPVPVPVAAPAPVPIPGYVGNANAARAPAAFTFGGGVTLPASAWAAVQESVDCVARLGSWEERAEPQLLFERPSVNADSASPLCSVAPFDRLVDPSLWYAWAPTAGCALAGGWSRASFCEALAGRELFLVGDSLTFTFHETLLSALLDPLDPELHEHSQWDTCPTHTLCAAEARAAPGRVKPGSLRYIRNDHATVAFSGKNPARNENMWVDALSANSLLVVNRGAHFVPDDELVQGVQTTIDWIAREAPRGMGVIWRNTVPGHELEDFLYNGTFARFKTPLRARHKYKENDKAAKYNWNLFPEQNAIVEGLVKAHMEDLTRAGGGGVGWLYLDVENSTVLRADRHKDGLHYCVPGPTDTWVRFLEFAMRAVSGAGAL